MEISIESNKTVGITDWELDRLVRGKTVENIANAIATLDSLSRQLTALSTIVVKDHIQTLVQQSLDELSYATRVIAAGMFDKGANHARQAIYKAEQAFFDPSVTSMLYFPGILF